MDEPAGSGAAPARRRIRPARVSRLRRVVLAIGQLELGGTERQVVLLAQGLRERGIDVCVAALREGGVFVPELRAAGIPVFEADFPRWPAPTLGLADRFLGPARAASAFRRYCAWLRAFRPDVVHAFLFFAYVVTPLAARLAGVPVTVSGRRSLATFKEGRRVALRLERAATWLTDLVVANSLAVAHDTVRQEGLSPDKLAVVPNGLPRAAFARAAAAVLDAPRPIVLYVANLRPGKGHDVLIRAAARLRAAGRRATLVFAGSGPQREPLRRLAVELDVDLRLLGPRRDVTALLAAADVVALPSLAEGFSNSVLEAMAAGRPIVATDVGGNPEALGETGVLVPVGDDAALAVAIGDLLAEPDTARALGAAARARAARLFSRDAMVDRQVALYEELLG